MTTALIGRTTEPNWSSSIKAMATRMKTIAPGIWEFWASRKSSAPASVAADRDRHARRPGSRPRIVWTRVCPAAVPASGLTTWRWTVEPRTSAAIRALSAAGRDAAGGPRTAGHDCRRRQRLAGRVRRSRTGRRPG